MTTNKTYTREEALKQSTEYFGGDELAANVFVTKYALRNEKLELKESNPEQMHRRLAKEFARIEKKYPNPMSEEEIFGLFDKFKYVCPQGSPMFGIGNQYQKASLSNCFVIDVADSYGGICRADERIAQISKRRGGIGLDISPLRPKGMSTKNSALTTDGIVVFMERFSNTAREVAQQGRRGAEMISISVHHPEILNFIKAKRDLKKITGANISVRITDEFMKAVIKKENYEQRWPVDSDKPMMKREVKAKEIWDELVKSNFSAGEPGILYWDTIIKNSPADSYSDLGYASCSTNPCITGNTLVYVADGRGSVSIKHLAEEDKDVPVFCYDNNGDVVVRTMRNPRITGYKEKTYKVILENGYTVRCTGNHKFLTKDGKYKEATSLTKGDDLKSIIRYKSTTSENAKINENYNQKVASVELDGTEDVYNGTVDEFHNFFIGAFEDNSRLIYINNKNCGELPLSPQSSCILLLQNLTSYVSNPFTKDAKLEEELLKINTRKSQKLIDDMVDLEIEAVQKIIDKIKLDPEDEKIKANELDLWQGVQKTCAEARRTGLGITGLGDCLAMLNIKYGSKESLESVNTIFSIIRNESYRSSIEMAKERGPFAIWNAKTEKDNKFLNRLPKDILLEMNKFGRRNIACLTVPPAGSVSTMTQTSSGFEPIFMAEYTRKRKLMESDKDTPDFIDPLGDKWKNYKVEHHGLKLFKKITSKELKDSPYFGAQAEEINYESRVKMQGIATSFIDHSISSTINLPKDIDIETIEKLYMLAWEVGCKGLTIYRDSSRDGVLTKEASTNGRACEDCDEAAKELKVLILTGHRPKKIIPTAAPSRDLVMKCEIHRSKVGKGDWLFFVGMLDNQPYEVFGGNSAKFEIPHDKPAWIVKNGKNKAGITQYNLVMCSLTDENEKFQIKDISKHFNNEKYGAMTRLLSLNLRHGVPIRFICEQLTKTGCAGDFFSFQRAMARILKKYIADGEISGTECPLCKSTDVYYKNGCPTCKVCGNSNCS